MLPLPVFSVFHVYVDMKLPFCCLLILVLLSAVAVNARPSSRLNVKIIADEAEAVLNILEKRADRAEITESDWVRIFESEGYKRLKKRELSFSRPFADETFRVFVMSDELFSRREALAATLIQWKRIDPSTAGNLALAYLPSEAVITAKIYPVIKPRENSFVFEVRSDPAIFLYLDPKTGAEKFENTLAHELHHIGFGTACPAPETKAKREKLPEGVKRALSWTGAFGEGLAMLAAAGAPNIHPHLVSDARERAEWDASMANFDADLRKVESFLQAVADGTLKGDEANQEGFKFFGVQGPWYTVGWKMATVIERAYGRERVIESFCDESKLLKTYNSAAKKLERRDAEKLGLWSEGLSGKLNAVN